MTKKRPYIGPSEAQSNAEVVFARDRPSWTDHQQSVRVHWDYRVRMPDDLRGLVRAARRAYEDEVPTKLHSSDPKAIGPDGYARMMPQAEGYIFSSPHADDVRPDPSDECGNNLCTHRREIHKDGRCEMRLATRDQCGCREFVWIRGVLSFHLTPFRATLDRMEKGDVHRKRRAAIVRHITIGGQEPITAAIMEEAHPLDARIVAEDALRVFLNSMSDVKLDLHREPEAA